MFNRIHTVLCLFHIFTSLGFAANTLKWEKDEIEIEHLYGNDRTVFSLTFHNDTGHDVEIGPITASCGCTVLTLENKKFGPGESGDIKASYSSNEEKAVVNIEVKGQILKDGSTTTITDRLKVHVKTKQPLTIKPAVVLWQAKKALTTKVIRVTVNEPSVSIIQPTFESSFFSFTTKEISPNALYEIEVTPLTTDTLKYENFPVLITSAEGKELKFFLHCIIR